MFELVDEFENYSIESHKGWIKYTVGDNSEYSKARNDRNELDKYNFPGPFVTAYNYGNRVTVQEALILTNQNCTTLFLYFIQKF